MGKTVTIYDIAREAGVSAATVSRAVSYTHLLGPADVLTPFGEAFLRADTVPAVQECFLRAMSMPMKPLKDGGCFSPLCWTLKVLLEIEKRTGSASVSFLEFAVCIQTTDPDWEMDRVAAVSYTHLDVYKRQTSGCSSWQLSV